MSKQPIPLQTFLAFRDMTTPKPFKNAADVCQKIADDLQQAERQTKHIKYKRARSTKGETA